MFVSCQVTVINLLLFQTKTIDLVVVLLFSIFLGWKYL